MVSSLAETYQTLLKHPGGKHEQEKNENIILQITDIIKRVCIKKNLMEKGLEIAL